MVQLDKNMNPINPAKKPKPKPKKKAKKIAFEKNIKRVAPKARKWTCQVDGGPAAPSAVQHFGYDNCM